MAAVLFVLCLFATGGWSQTLRGTVTDSLTGEPLAFVNIVVQQRKTGTTTDIDGKFRLSARAGETLIFSHVGYRPALVRVPAGAAEIPVLLKPDVMRLGGVTIVATENPAWRIIRNATAAKQNHRPERRSSYTYKKYSKTILTVAGPPGAADSLRQKRVHTKLSASEALTVEGDSIRQRQHLLVAENVTENFFRQPDRHSSRLLDYKISGFRSPTLLALMQNFGPINIFDDWITVLGKEHRSPLTKNSERVYDFTLADTTFYEGDSVFVITFEPLDNSGQQLLRGQVSVSRSGWALKNIIAHSADPFAKIDFRIQQNQQLTAGYWFPEQINTTFIMREMEIGMLNPVIDTRSYLREVRLDLQLPTNVFESAEVIINHNRDTTQLTQHRGEKYDSLERRTFDFYDSLQRTSSTLRRFENLFEVFFRGTLRTGKVDWLMSRIISFNRFEGLRPGVGWRTNQRFSQRLSLGVYAAYGLNDNLWKYGGDLAVRILRNPQVKLELGYRHDVIEPGVHAFFEEYPGLAQFSVRPIFATRMDLAEQFRARLRWKPAASWSVRAGLNSTHFRPQFAYAFTDGTHVQTDFRITEVVGELAYVQRLREMQFAGVRRVVGLGHNRFCLAVAQGLAGLGGGDYRFTRFEFYYTARWRTRGLGTSTTTLLSGYLHGVAPLQRQFFGPGGRETRVWARNAFNTMGIYEFLTDRYVAAFWHHNLGYLYQTRRSKPELILWQAAGIGDIGRPENAAHLGIAANNFRSGYFESGLGADNLLRFNYADIAYLGVGAGVFYRWGHYALPLPIENMAVRLSATIGF